jgi:mannobiose 2-epimerase
VHDHKQLYGQAFVIYAFSEYHLATGNQQALTLAIDLFDLVETHGADRVHEGYWEVCDREWRVLKGNRLSEKDLPADKSMNTHLHLLEAYTRLAAYAANDRVYGALDRLLQLYTNRVIDPATHSQFLYFSTDWIPLIRTRSFGHDVEASWLLYEAAVQLNNPLLMERVASLSVDMLEATAQALDVDGGILYEYDPESDHLNREKHWWPQAEGLVGYLNAFQLTGDVRYVNRAWRIWSFIRSAIKHPTGEWVWGRDAHGVVMETIKAGFWKCPYHNGRACLELIHRIDRLLTESTSLS